MNLNHLRIFVAVAEEKSITRGASRLQISQPAVSKELRDLERSLDISLMDRTPHGISLTDAGAVLLEYARKMFGVEVEAERILDEMKGLARGRLILGASTTVGIYKMPEALRQFKDRYPNIDIQVEINNDHEIQRSLLDRRCDLAYTGGFIEHADLVSKAIMTDQLVAVASPDHPAARRRSLRLKDLAKTPLILREHGSGMRAVLERYMASKGLNMSDVMSLASTEAVKRAAALGIGVAVISSLTVEAELKRTELVTLDVEGLPLERPIRMVQLKDRSQSHAIRAFHSALMGSLHRTSGI